MKPLIWKELRENIRWVPIGLLVVTAICWMAHSGLRHSQSLLATGLVTQLAIVTPLLAFALGVVQAYRDLQPAAGAYVNHRGVTSSDVFWAKIISGFALYMTAIVLPLIGLALWVGYQGMWWYPTRPAQVIPAFVFALAAFVLHPAAMLMMSRRASWWGTRLFPLVPAGSVLTAFFGSVVRGGLPGAGWCLLFAVPILVWMAFIARQGWQELASDPPAASVNPKLRRRWLLPTYMPVGTTVCYCAAVILAIIFIEQASRSNVYVPTPTATLAVDVGSEELWFITRLQKYDAAIGNYTHEILGGETVDHGSEVDAMASDAIGREFHTPQYLTQLRQGYWSSDGFFTQPNNSFGSSLAYSYDTRGYLLGYEQYPQARWVKTISADGVHPAGELVGKPFEGDPLGAGWSVFSLLVNEGYPGPLIGREGVWFIDQEPIALRKIIEMDIVGGVLLRATENDAPRLVLRSGNQLHEYRLIDESGSDDWYTPSEAGMNARNRQMSMKLRLDAELVRTFTVPESIANENTLMVAWTPQSLLITKHDYRWKNPVAYRIKPNGSGEKIVFLIDPNSIQKVDDDKFGLSLVAIGTMPGGAFLIVLMFATWMVVTGQPTAGDPFGQIAAYPIGFSTVAVTFVVITALAFWLVHRVAYRRGLSATQTRWWTWSVPILGLTAPLAIVPIATSERPNLSSSTF